MPGHAGLGNACILGLQGHTSTEAASQLLMCTSMSVNCVTAAHFREPAGSKACSGAPAALLGASLRPGVLHQAPPQELQGAAALLPLPPQSPLFWSYYPGRSDTRMTPGLTLLLMHPCYSHFSLEYPERTRKREVRRLTTLHLRWLCAHCKTEASQGSTHNVSWIDSAKGL